MIKKNATFSTSSTAHAMLLCQGLEMKKQIKMTVYGGSPSESNVDSD